jgi:two-component system, NtrC family, response regulator AtoC
MSPEICPFPRFDNLLPESILFGKSEAMQALRSTLHKVAGASVPILIQGESGTGKSIIARAIHILAPWKSGPFVSVNCHAPETLLELEPFGHDKGDFSPEYGTKPGRVEMAHRGTLFLDEISELDLERQSKLLRLLQHGQLCRIDAQQDRKVEFRLVCATSRHLQAEIENGRFRPDLFYRINVVNLRLPPLRERRGDIEGLVHYFLESHNRKYNCRTGAPSGELLALLENFHWPGNIRELENLIQRYVILGNEKLISNELVARSETELLNPAINLDGPISLKKLTREVTRELERKVILKALQANHWNRKQAARALCISYRGLLYKIHEADLIPNPSSRSQQPAAARPKRVANL